MRIADHRGCSLAEIREDSQELNLWLAYYQLHGFPQDRQDFRAAIIAWTVASSFGGGRHKVSDFVPDFEPQAKPALQKWEDMREFFKGLAEETQNGKHDCKGEPIAIR